VDNAEFEKDELSEIEETDAELAALEDDAEAADDSENAENAFGDSEDSGDSEGINEPVPVKMPVYALSLAYSRETLYGIYRDGAVPQCVYVILHTRYGMDMARVRGEMKRNINPQRILRIERIATEEDFKKAEKYRIKEKEAFPLCKERIAFHKLEMKLIAVHYLHDEQKILFFFSAENRIDFRTLVKDLVGIFRCRIELRQISTRDESRIGGGFGICGRCYCCSTITDKLKPVSIKMAKEQNLSLNTAKISGPCGRLLCCLAYEHGFYCAERHNMPNEGTRVMFEGESWRVKELNPVCASVTITAEDGRQTQVAANRFVKTDNKWSVSKAAVSDDKGGKAEQRGATTNDRA
jgi:cell fate regulator YaaT (PSP1 superfamily)